MHFLSMCTDTDFALVTVGQDEQPTTLNDENPFAANAGKIDKKMTVEFRCKCKQNKGQPCSLHLTLDELRDLRSTHQALERDEIDFVILGQISAGIHRGEMTQTTKRKEQSLRSKVRIQYMHRGFPICRETFLYIHGIFKDRLTNLIAHFLEHGITRREHGNKKRLPSNTVSYTERQFVVKFINNYAEDHAVLLPGRVPGYRNDDLKLLPSSCTKCAVFQDYKTACESAGVRATALRTFYLVIFSYFSYFSPLLILLLFFSFVFVYCF